MEVMLTKEQKELKNQFIESQSYWNTTLEQMLLLDPDFFKVFLKFSIAPQKKRALTPKNRELVYIAVNVSCTHLYEQQLRVHIRKALKEGATKEEIMEVFQLTSVLGMHTCSLGIPMLMEDNDALLNAPLSEKQIQQKETFEKQMGYFSEFREGILRYDENFFNAYYELLSYPWRKGSLEPKMKEFIYIAIDSSTTHLFEKGLKIHLHNALKVGATKDEIMEVFEITSSQGFNTLDLGIPILIDEMNRI